MDIAKIERHQMLANSHLTIVQSLKYPGTIAPEAVAKARARIDACALLSVMDNPDNLKGLEDRAAAKARAEAVVERVS